MSTNCHLLKRCIASLKSPVIELPAHFPSISSVKRDQQLHHQQSNSLLHVAGFEHRPFNVKITGFMFPLLLNLTRIKVVQFALLITLRSH